MPRLSRRAALQLAPLAALPLPAAPARKKRRDSFFGIHLDLHPGPADKDLGRDLSRANLEYFLAQVQPDYVQYDCKGHVGWLGYPDSKVSKSAPGIVNDSLALWRLVTEERGVSLYIHFSGVWDSLAITDHPEWARVKPDGTRDDRQTSLWVAYADQRMIPQLLEASERYRLDGAWVDGECWQTSPDYSDAAIRAWRGLLVGEPPRKPEDPNWLLWLEFQRGRFREYVRHYVDTLHNQRPNFEIASNWLYTTYVPEKPELPVDFLSGDYLGNAAISGARLDARYLAQTGKPWDLMAWGFQVNAGGNGHVHKPAIQLEQEAAVVLAQGGGFQIYYQPTRAGRIDDRHINVMAQVSRFARSRQALSHKSESRSEIAVLFSKTTLYNTSNKLFGGWGNRIAPAKGLLDAIVENHRSVDILPDWAVAEKISRYSILAIPDWADVGQLLARDIATAVRSGLRVLIAGAANANLFAPLLGWQVQDKPTVTAAYIPGEEIFANVHGLWQHVLPGAGKVLLERYPTFDSKLPGLPAALHFTVGRGQVVLLPGPIGEAFEANHAPALRQAVGTALRALGSAQIELPASNIPVECVLRAQGSQTVLHLLNHQGKQLAANYPAIDSIPPVPALAVRVRTPKSPKELRWEPGSTKLPFRYREGMLEFEAPSFAIHAMAVWS